MAKAKGQRRLWTPLAVNTTIGAHDYDIEPQPVQRYQAFSEIIERLFSQWTTKDAAASGDVITWVLDLPHPVLQVFIPDLTEEDALSCSVPQLHWLVDTIWEVNGFNWFKDVLKNVPLFPSVQKAVAAGQAGNSRGQPLPASESGPTNQAVGTGAT